MRSVAAIGTLLAALLAANVSLGAAPPPSAPPPSAVPPRAAPVVPEGLALSGKNEEGNLCFRNLKDRSLLILVPAGAFKMGRDDGPSTERPAREVKLSAYLISKYEVTWGQYLEFCAKAGHKVPERPAWATNKHPVANVTWGDAAAYCDWAGLRLPSEAEWERAARGTEDRVYPWGDDDPAGTGHCKYGEQQCYLKEADKWPRPVGSYPIGASPVGALDLAGNVAEWCRDNYDGGYYAAAQAADANQDPTGPAKGDYRCVRGGAWCYEQEKLRTTTRFLFDPDAPFVGIGFRAARSYP